ncbi:MAG: phenylacetate--CoA ligase family protein, partial [bacterium]|nr:phenylacetate--CoA ligase family protein [bacterium]
PEDIRTPGDFSKIPPTEKKHYRKNFPIDVLAKGYTLKDDRLSRFPSAGTTGERLLTVELGIIYMKRAVDSMSVYPLIHSIFNSQPLNQIRYAPPNCSDVECANPYSTMQDRLLRDGTLVLAVYHDLLTTPEVILEQNMKEVEKHQPQLYFIDSTHLAFLMRYMRKHGYTPPKAPLLASYTPCSNVSRRQVLENFGRDVHFSEVVAMSEMGYVAMECPVGGLHINSKSYYLEFICNGRPAEPGEMAELYITTLDNGCIPHIRYRTGDVYRFFDSQCLCGHEFPLIRIEGRLRNFLFRNGEIVLTPKELDGIVGAPLWMDMYKMKQADDDDFLFNFVPNDKYEENNEKYIREELLQKLGADAHLVMEKTDYIPTERSGKFLACISSVGEKIYTKGFCL